VEKMRLIVTEKDTTAKRIAAILADGKVKEEKSFKFPVYGFKNGKVESHCIGLKGHILKVDYPEEYNNWQKVRPADLIDAEIVKVPTQKILIKALQKEAKEATEVIIATDFDREGELIGLDATNKIREVNPDVTVKRARFSALTKPEVTRAFTNLEELRQNLALAGEARQDIDLIWGATLTRFISLASSRLGRQFLSVGRVQSPTLVVIAGREKERQAFVPKPYWQIRAIFQFDSEKFEAHHKTDRFWEKKEADAVLSRLGDEALVKAITKSQRTVAAPAPFNTTALLSAAATSLGLSAPNTMRIAESLYMSGLISYPRVDNTVYPDSLDFRDILETLSQGELGDLSRGILAQEKIIPTRGKRFATDHPPIHPTDVAKRSALEPQAWRVYEMVVRRFLATLAKEALIETLRAEIDASGEYFYVKGNRVASEGWLKFYHYSRKKDHEIPPISEGMKLKLMEALMDEKETQPPPRYGQGRLIQLMEELGLGTKATRHNIIQNLYDRNYVHSDPIIPTEMGLAVAESLRKYAEAISSPQMTAELEKEMDAIVEGNVERKEVVDRSRKMLGEVMKVLELRKEEVAGEIRLGIREGKIIGKCPKCGGDLRIVRSRKTKKRFVGCSNYPNCDQAYPLPQRGEIIPLNELCEECGAPKIKVLNKGSRPWILCIDPNCPSKTSNSKSGPGAKDKASGQES
jgi:DNA topoisomerase-1